MKRAILSLSLFLAIATIPLNTPSLFGSFSHGVAYADTQAGDICKNISSQTEQNACKGCFNGGGAWTAIGCVGEGGNPSVFITKLVDIGIGLGGGVAFLLILVSGFQTIVSAGNPEKLHAAKELMTAAISGLLLIIFSIFLLRLIGVEIFQLPGLG